MRRTRRNRLFVFAGQIARVYLGYSTRENFLASLGPVVLNSSSPPVSARRRKERRTFPTNRGERDLRDREGDGGKNSAQTGEKEIFGEIRRSTRETRKTRERTVGSRKNESTKNVTSVRFRSVMVKSGGRRECSEGIGLRSDFGRIRCGRHRKAGSLLAAKIKNDRLDKERQPLFVLVPSWLSPVGGEANRGHRIAVRLRSDSVWFAIEK